MTFRPKVLAAGPCRAPRQVEQVLSPGLFGGITPAVTADRIRAVRGESFTGILVLFLGRMV